ncbi:MAG: hypothetical protein EAZ92_17110 [Candidatus Kapaibacterium sp.]|nr:MAG: hypothetical protein EAZ92_17110 [Candidatus Kapabacteria bacterium]
MGEMTIIHGRITLHGSTYQTCEAGKKAIANIGNDTEYPYLRSEMFSIGAVDNQFYYQQPVIAFAATYKSLEHDWNGFKAKFEAFLRQLDFDTAKLEMETEFYGSFHCFWVAKNVNTRFDEEEHFTETDEWFVGYGYRTQFGTLQIPYDEEHSPPYDE